jgi:hypothetical protein
LCLWIECCCHFAICIVVVRWIMLLFRVQYLFIAEWNSRKKKNVKMWKWFSRLNVASHQLLTLTAPFSPMR